uniref:NADH-ubiquinone oxidoreductase chain 6 n=1 Tax=Aleocharinae sp. 5 EF-2015 TaxID=1756847 RepID=A0A0S2M8P1_9COLE|nr:NADH deshydrogenase subunit 6 [Aleocharinae sp. 5 EF-2015]
MLMMTNFILSLIFMFSTHPMMMGLILLLQTITISLITGLLSSNFWFSYILFLIMVGGMLVLFIYMTSIASNEMFNYSNNITLLMMLVASIIFCTHFFTDKLMINLKFMFMESLLNYFPAYSLTKYFNYPSMLMIFFMILYLFITLVAIVKITKIEFGPLRQLV